MENELNNSKHAVKYIIFILLTFNLQRYQKGTQSLTAFSFLKTIKATPFLLILSLKLIGVIT